MRGTSEMAVSTVARGAALFAVDSFSGVVALRRPVMEGTRGEEGVKRERDSSAFFSDAVFSFFFPTERREVKGRRMCGRLSAVRRTHGLRVEE